MTEHQKKNINSLLKIKEYDTKLDMTIFHSYGDDCGIDPDDYSCGTAACLAGHLPLTTGTDKEYGESWNDYILRVTGIEQDSSGWKYLFSSAWNNSKEDAMWRVQTFIGNHYKAPIIF